MENKIEGRITQVLPLESGTSKSGKEWKKQGYVLETNEQYPKKVKFHFFGDKAGVELHEGDVVEVCIDIESREFNGRWYTDVSAWKAEVKQSAQPQAQPQQAQVDYDQKAQEYFENQPNPTPNGELPF